MMLPRYFVGTGAEHLTMTANRKSDPHSAAIGEYYGWSPDAILTPASLMYYTMRRGDKIPHPNWYPFPHIIDSTTVIKAWKGVTHPAVQKAVAHGLITQADTTFTAVQKLHAQMGIFLP